MKISTDQASSNVKEACNNYGATKKESASIAAC